MQTQINIIASNNSEPPPAAPAISGRYDFDLFGSVSFSEVSGGRGGGVDGSKNKLFSKFLLHCSVRIELT